MANVFAESAAGGNGCRLDWSLTFDDQADTVTITATHRRFDGTAAPNPQEAQITLTLNSSVSIGVNLLTGRMSNNQLFDGQNRAIVNDGPRVRTGVRLRVSADRAASLTFSTEYTPPA